MRRKGEKRREARRATLWSAEAAASHRETKRNETKREARDRERGRGNKKDDLSSRESSGISAPAYYARVINRRARPSRISIRHIFTLFVSFSRESFDAFRLPQTHPEYRGRLNYRPSSIHLRFLLAKTSLTDRRFLTLCSLLLMFSP